MNRRMKSDQVVFLSDPMQNLAKELLATIANSEVRFDRKSLHALALLVDLLAIAPSSVEESGRENA